MAELLLKSQRQTQRAKGNMRIVCPMCGAVMAMGPKDLEKMHVKHYYSYECEGCKQKISIHSSNLTPEMRKALTNLKQVHEKKER